MVTAAVSSLSVFEVGMGLSPDPEPMLHDAHPALLQQSGLYGIKRGADMLTEYMEYKSVQGWENGFGQAHDMTGIGCFNLP